MNEVLGSALLFYTGADGYVLILGHGLPKDFTGKTCLC